MRVFALTLAVLAGVTSSAAADTTLSTGLMGVNPAGGGTDVVCLVTNIGTKPVTTVSRSMFDNLGSVAPTSDGCAEIAAGETCSFGKTGATLLLGGRIVVKGSTKKLRGRCIARVGFDLVDSAEMR